VPQHVHCVAEYISVHIIWTAMKHNSVSCHWQMSTSHVYA